MDGVNFYIVDVETTGLDSTRQEVTEISIIRYSDKVQLTQLIKCDFPERANFDALEVTGKTLEDLKLGVSKEIAVNKVNQFLEEDGATNAHRCFVGHKVISFDKKFIHALYNKVNKELPVDLWLDTWEMIRFFADKTGLKDDAKKSGNKLSYTLHASCDMVGIKKFSLAHSSKIDTRNNYLLFKDLTENKSIDYLPFIKTFPHYNKSLSELEEIDV